MILLPAEVHRESPLMLLEIGLTLIVFAAAFAWPRLGQGVAGWVARGFDRLARRKLLSVFVVGLTALLLRVALLPLFPIPCPFLPDDFSNLLVADTFAHGRLANVTPAMWMHMETIHVEMLPTYASMYFPAQGLVLALGKVVLGHPWFGVLLASALFAAALTWMLQAWLPARWALLGGLLAVVHLCLFSYWINTYTGAGFISGLGGALVLGALPRVKQKTRLLDCIWLALGASILAIVRPYEGLLLCLPVLGTLVLWIVRDPRCPAAAVLARRAVLPVLILLGTLAWFGLYNQRAFGKATTLPYTINRAEYAMAPYFIWQPPRPEPQYRHEALRHFYYESEMKAFNKARGWGRFVPIALLKLFVSVRFFAGFTLMLPLLAMHRTLRDRRMRFLVQCLLVLTAGMLIEIFLIPHYLAAFVPVFYVLGVQSMRHLNWWRPGGQPVGRAMVRFAVVACLALAVLRAFAGPLKIEVGEWPASSWSGMWFGPAHFGTERAALLDRLEQMPGTQLVMVRYGAQHEPLDEWVYNSAEVESSKVIWAREMNPALDRELLNYYSKRTVWLVEPDASPARLTPYAAAAH